MPFIVAHPEVSLLRCRAYAKKYGDRAAQKSDERALGRESAHSRTTPYGFGETRVATLALLTVTTPSLACGVVMTKFSGHAVTFRSSPTVFADTPMLRSTSTRILSGKPPSAIWSAAMLLS
jgi:hypothetical protein